MVIATTHEDSKWPTCTTITRQILACLNQRRLLIDIDPWDISSVSGDFPSIFFLFDNFHCSSFFHSHFLSFHGFIDQYKCDRGLCCVCSCRHCVCVFCFDYFMFYFSRALTTTTTTSVVKIKLKGSAAPWSRLKANKKKRAGYFCFIGPPIALSLCYAQW